MRDNTRQDETTARQAKDSYFEVEEAKNVTPNFTLELCVIDVEEKRKLKMNEM